MEAGSRSPVKVSAPTQATDQDIEEHEVTHLPSRNPVQGIDVERCRSRTFGQRSTTPDKGVPHGLHVGVHGRPLRGDENDDGLSGI